MAKRPASGSGRRLTRSFLLPALLLSSCVTQPVAASSPPVPATTTSWSSCFDAAARHYRLHAALLRAIARQESGMNPRAIGKNTNGTLDLGLMQINTSWLPKLAQVGISREHLMDPCTNILVGAWVLHEAVQRHGLSWKAVGVYHSPTPWRQRAYASKVAAHLLKEPGVRLNVPSVNSSNALSTDAAIPPPTEQQVAQESTS